MKQMQQAQAETQKAPSEHQEMLFLLSTGTGCPGTLWNLPPWRYSKGARPGPGSRWPCLSRVVVQDGLQKSLPTSTIL